MELIALEKYAVQKWKKKITLDNSHISQFSLDISSYTT